MVLDQVEPNPPAFSKSFLQKDARKCEKMRLFNLLTYVSLNYNLNVHYVLTSVVGETGLGSKPNLNNKKVNNLKKIK
jgi:hypothetical protein